MVKPVLLKNIQIEGNRILMVLNPTVGCPLAASCFNGGSLTSRGCLHVGVLSVQARHLQPHGRLLCVRAVSQEHLLQQGGQLLHCLQPGGGLCPYVPQPEPGRTRNVADSMTVFVLQHSESTVQEQLM